MQLIRCFLTSEGHAHYRLSSPLKAIGYLILEYLRFLSQGYTTPLHFPAAVVKRVKLLKIFGVAIAIEFASW